MAGITLTKNPAGPDSSPAREDAALLESAGYSTPGAGLLALDGGESLDFLNRLSTNDLKNLPAGSLRPTVLTTEKGRIIDVVLVLNLAPRILLVVSEGNSAVVKSWLEKFIIMEEITVTDVTLSYRLVSIFGTNAASIAGSLTGLDRPAEDASGFRGGREEGVILYRSPLWKSPPCPVPVYDLLLEASRFDSLIAAHALPAEAGRLYERLRVENGIPRLGAEIDERVNPLEAGLTPLVSFTKGCYIGQEVIARLDTYKKLQRRLRGFIFPAGYDDPTPGLLYLDGMEAGWTTSHAPSTMLGKHVALGYLKVFPEADVAHFRLPGAAAETEVKVVDLPFRPD